MEQLLIKISDNHYVIVDDSEIKEGDWYWTPIKRSIEQCVRRVLIIKGGDNDKKQFKITYSTQPLEDSIELDMYGGITDIKTFKEITPLPLSEIEELIYGYSVDSEWNKLSFSSKHNGNSWSFKEGFKAHQKLTKNKLFTIEDMEKIIKKALHYWTQNATTEKEAINDILQSVSPKTQWKVKFNEQGKLELV